MPNMERMAKHGTLYKKAIAPAGSTLMCHSSEWTGKYTWELHGDLPFEDRLYPTPIPFQESVFTDLEKRGYDIHIIMVEKRPGKCYDSYKPVYELWPKSANIVLLPDWDCPGGETIRRKDQIMKAAELIEESEANGRPAFVWLKCHGYNKENYRSEYLRYAGQQRVTDDDLYNAEIDEALGSILDHFNYPDNNCPTIWFASDHGGWAGEKFRNWYGYHLDQEIVHVPLICSDGGGRIVDSLFSMKEVRRLITGDEPRMGERFIMAETLYPGQIAENPDSGVFSTARIMVRLNRWKYTYSLFGPEGDSPEPCEELFDLAYDPREKFDLAAAFHREHKDVARPAESGPLFHHVSPRINSNQELATDPSGLPSKIDDVEFKNTRVLSGWPEIYNILTKLRSVAKNIWQNTGRERYFKL